MEEGLRIYKVTLLQPSEKRRKGILQRKVKNHDCTEVNWYPCCSHLTTVEEAKSFW